MAKTLDKTNYIIYFIVCCSALLVLKASQLQIFDKKYQAQAKRATLDKSTIYPGRGLIYDRNKRLMVTNTSLYDIEVIYKNVRLKDSASFCNLLNIDNYTLQQNLNKDWRKPQYHKSVPFIFLQKVNPSSFFTFQEHLHKFPGFYPKLKSMRSYPHQFGANVLGYLGEVNQTMIDNSDGIYRAGDYVGVTGIERVYEEVLRGKKGVSYILKDNLGREVSSYDNGSLDSAAVAGDDLMSGIDLELQGYAESLMVNKRGSIVAIDPKSGEILTMVSAPTYDPNLIALDKKRGNAFDSLLNDTKNKPFLDRSIMALYPPGSIFKTILSLIALQKGVLYPNRTIYCDGVYELDSRGSSVQRCHAHPTPYNVSIAIQHSCNSYFYQTMRDMVNLYGYTTPGKGLDTLVDYLQDFGLGHALGSDVFGELNGFIPDSKFYNKVYKKDNAWRATYILSVGIGQGELQITTLQMANLAAIIANRGYYIVPHLIKANLTTNEPITDKFLKKKFVRIDQQHFPPVIEGMARAVSGGTATAASVPGLDVCGKTGTSENPFGKDHSVFFGFAPRENPKIAIAVYVENAGWGGEVATPIAGLVIEKYLNKDIDKYRKFLETKMLNTNLIDEEKL